MTEMCIIMISVPLLRSWSSVNPVDDDVDHNIVPCHVTDLIVFFLLEFVDLQKNLIIAKYN